MNYSDEYSLPYKNPRWIKIDAEFFHHRFLLDMALANDLADGACLWTISGSSSIFYKDDTRSIRFDLSKVTGPFKCVAKTSPGSNEAFLFDLRTDAAEQVVLRISQPKDFGDLKTQFENGEEETRKNRRGRPGWASTNQ